MQITSNADKLALQLEQFSKDFKRKLEYMTTRFAEEVAYAAAKNTPIGDPMQYPALYKLRQDRFGIPIEAGFHQGGWSYEEDSNIPFSPNINSITEMQNDVFGEADRQYQLGNTFYIGASGPAYVKLEQGLSDQAPNGIMQPTIELVKTAIESNLKQYYDET